MIAFFVLRGHSLDQMLGLSTAEKIVYGAIMNKYMEEMEV